MKKFIVATAGLCISMMAPTAGQAGYEIWDTSVSTCTGLNCSSVVFGGTVMNAVGASTARWEGAVFANRGECLRLDETAMFGSGADDEMVVVGPNGTVWRNDDFSGLRPRVAFIAPQRGWYYVTIAHFAGNPNPEHDFVLAYGRYSGSSNPNCASATPGFAPASVSKAPGAGVAPPAAGPTGGGH
ncbi:hypothetical protein [Methylocystis sp. ATCC 49242]|uniref:hypothetical protein n=1 Tax=Methylocystis sp. ATCC 49242 TaxID=622637 RepID=UPI0001F8807B|nr:hypothetical protein [Methylocystis sp. ATCC 49242]